MAVRAFGPVESAGQVGLDRGEQVQSGWARFALGVCADLGLALSLVLVLTALGTVGVLAGLAIGLGSVAYLTWSMATLGARFRRAGTRQEARVLLLAAERDQGTAA